MTNMLKASGTGTIAVTLKPAPPDSGVYKLVTVLTHRNFGSVSDVSAVEEGPFLRIG